MKQKNTLEKHLILDTFALLIVVGGGIISLRGFMKLGFIFIIFGVMIMAMGDSIYPFDNTKRLLQRGNKNK